MHGNIELEVTLDLTKSADFFGFLPIFSTWSFFATFFRQKSLADL